jgi:hypothetical protein
MFNMATKLLQVELLEKKIFVEIEAEETMPFSLIVTKLKTEGYLESEGIYFIKTPTGISIRENIHISLTKQDVFVITENPDWKSTAVKSSSLTDIQEIDSPMILNDNTYWLLPYCSGANWRDDALQSQLFSLSNVNTSNGKKMLLHIVVQYSLIDTTLSGSKHVNDRTAKMKQILGDALNIELAVNNINENNFYENCEKLNGKMRHYITSHMELKWGTKIECVTVVGFREHEII